MLPTICEVGVHEWLSDDKDSKGEAGAILFDITALSGKHYVVDICLACGQLKPTEVK